MHRIVDFAVRTEMDVRMRMRRAVVSVRVRMDEQAFRPTAHSRRSFADQAGCGADAEQNQHDRDGEFHRESEPRRNRDFENDDRGPDYQHGDRVAESPYDADAGGDREAAFSAEDGSNGNHVIGIGRVAHPEQQSEERNRERRGVGRNHQVAP